MLDIDGIQQCVHKNKVSCLNNYGEALLLVKFNKVKKMNNKKKAQQCTPNGVINQMVEAATSDSEIEQTIQFSEGKQSDELERLKEQSGRCYLQSRVERYKAIGYAYVWLYTAMSNTQYIEKAFEGMTARSPNANYLNSLKYCFNIDDDSKASTLSKYAKVMSFVEDKIGRHIIDAADPDQFVEKIVDLITENGGVDKIAEDIALNKKSVSSGSIVSIEQEQHGDDEGDSELECDSPSANEDESPLTESVTTVEKPKLTREYFDGKMREYVASKPIASFTPAENVKSTTTGLVVMVGVADGSAINVVELLPDDDVLKALIKARAISRSSSSPSQGHQ